ncbi:hypothetical protein [Labedella endophytica]|uniref:DUF3558 domain-containing protein n=1 Tax=Labedella endophytica TaxID=1523160 RepID=A0A433JNE5_9MICO|nr:hypothetical protein [Labedella endophytica]RUQ97605.1 hypothetical protein ELQ94_15700 [Labedella endophytica]
MILTPRSAPPRGRIALVLLSLLALASCAAEPSETGASSSETPSTSASATPAPSGVGTPEPTSSFALPTTCDAMTDGIFDPVTSEYPIDAVNTAGPEPEATDDRERYPELLDLLVDAGGASCTYIFQDREAGQGGLDGSGQEYTVAAVSAEQTTAVVAQLEADGFTLSDADGRDVYAIVGTQEGEYDLTAVHVLSDGVWISGMQNLGPPLEEMLESIDGIAGNVGAW